MSSGDRFPYLSATVLDQAFLDACQDNLTCDLEMIADIEGSDGAIIRASDRNKYVGSTFYQALLEFPVISRTVGEWLAGQTTFSTMQLNMSNVDKRFNRLMPEGADFGGWIDRLITISLGLRDVASTYKAIFKGSITPEAGFGRTVKSVKLVARDFFDKLNTGTLPAVLFTTTEFPDIEDKYVGKGKPLIYGDWTTMLADLPARVPAFVVNGADVNVIGGTRTNVHLVISDNDNRLFDQTQVWLKRSANYYLVDTADVVNVAPGKNVFEIAQNGVTVVDGSPFALVAADEFYVQVKGKAVPGGYHDNFVEIARQILKDFGGAVTGDFDANWDAFRDKAAPSESAVVNMKCRVHQQESISALDVGLSLLEQCRLEGFISKDEKIKINSLHFDDFVAAPSFNVQNWDVVLDSWLPAIDLRNNFNRATGFYSRMPDNGQNQFQTPYFRNAAAIAQSRRVIQKGLVFPNHYVTATVEDQTREILKLASSFFEIIEAKLTWRAMLQDIGAFVRVNVKIGSTTYTDVPMMVRTTGFDPLGMKIPVRLWSMQMVPFPGYTPTNPGIVGGYSATITQE